MIESISFILGLVLGSFLNVLIWRLDKNEKLVWDRSKCPHCSHKLGFFDLIPVFSFIFLKGRCRYCRSKISWQYPLVELICGLGFWAITRWVGVGWPEKIWLAGLFSLGLVIFVYDLRYFLIPDSFVITGLVWVLVGIFFLGQGNFVSGLIGGATLFSFFWFLHLISGGSWVGGGDIKLGFVLGLLLGWQLSLVALLLAYILGAVTGLALVFFRQANFKSQVPFGPFLVLSTAIAQVWGLEIVKWYAGLFF